MNVPHPFRQEGDDVILSDEECPKCGHTLLWRQCWNCEDGLAYHECGDDCCCCEDPEPNVECDICGGDGGWLICPNWENHLQEKIA